MSLCETVMWLKWNSSCHLWFDAVNEASAQPPARVTSHKTTLMTETNYASLIAPLLVAIVAVGPEEKKTSSVYTYESTWFSKDRMTGNGDVLKAHSAMASITSWKTRTDWNQFSLSTGDTLICQSVIATFILFITLFKCSSNTKGMVLIIVFSI